MIPKYRMWHLKEKQMGEVDSLSLHNNNAFSSSLWWARFGGDNQECIIMQSTGLLDKHGAEIYHYDILKVFLGKKRGYAITMVWYLAPQWLLGDYTTGKLNGSFKMADWGAGESIDEFEIIGNKFTHPDLLEQEHDT